MRIDETGAGAYDPAPEEEHEPGPGTDDRRGPGDGASPDRAGEPTEPEEGPSGPSGAAAPEPGRCEPTRARRARSWRSSTTPAWHDLPRAASQTGDITIWLAGRRRGRPVRHSRRGSAG